MASPTAVTAVDDVVGPRRKQGGGGASPTPTQQPPPPELGLRCPRCDSLNTKFCYYNNYSLSQPRHFCKTCRRYWTKGGALRNVPVGGGCRKNKRSRSAASSASAAVAVAAASSRLSSSLNNLPVEYSTGAAATDQQAAARLGFLGGGAPVVSLPIGGTTGTHYQGAAAGMMMALPRLHAPAVVGHYVPFGEWPSSAVPGIDNNTSGSGRNVGRTGAVSSSSIASSIESLSFINQDLHWKLQQQRLATMFVGPPPTSSGAAVHVEGLAPEQADGGPFQLHMAGAPAMEVVPAAMTTSWFMDSSYVFPSPPPLANTAAAVVTTTDGNVVNSSRSSADDENATSNSNCGSAIPAWSDMSMFAMLP